MTAIKKITIHIPVELLERAQEATGQGITETIRRGLQIVATKNAYAGLRQWRGKIQLDPNYKKTRGED